MKYSKLKNEPSDLLEGIFSWLTIDSFETNQDKKNSGGGVRWTTVNKFLFQPSRLKSILLSPVKFLVPRSIISKVKESIYQLNVFDENKNTVNNSEEDSVRLYLEKFYEKYNSH